MPLTPIELENMQNLVTGGRLTEIVIEQAGIRTVIGGPLPAPVNSVAVTAPSTGTITFGDTTPGNFVNCGDKIAQLSVLGSCTPVSSPQSGHIAAILAEEGALVGYGTELVLIYPKASS